MHVARAISDPCRTCHVLPTHHPPPFARARSDPCRTGHVLTCTYPPPFATAATVVSQDALSNVLLASFSDAEPFASASAPEQLRRARQLSMFTEVRTGYR